MKNIKMTDRTMKLNLANTYVDDDVTVEIPEGYLKPENTIEITENGIVDVSQFASASVSVASSGSGGNLLSYAKEILDNDTEDYPAKAIIIFPADFQASFVNLFGTAIKFSDEQNKLYPITSANNRPYDIKPEWDESKCDPYVEDGITKYFKWYIVYFENTTCKFSYGVIEQALAVYIKDAEYFDVNSNSFLQSGSTGTYNYREFEYFDSNKPLKITKNLSLGSTGTAQQYPKLKTLVEFDTSDFIFNTFALKDNSFIKSIKAKNGLRVKKLQIMNNFSLIEIPDIYFEGTTSLSNNFLNNHNLREIILHNTESLTSVTAPFGGCTNLITLEGLNLINVTSCSLLSYNKKLENLKIYNIKTSLTIASGTSWGHLLTVDSLINTCKELIKTGSSLTLTMGTTNLNKLADIYVKFTDPSITEIADGEKGDVVVCDSTDEGAMLITDYTTMKGWTLK